MDILHICNRNISFLYCFLKNPVEIVQSPCLEQKLLSINVTLQFIIPTDTFGTASVSLRLKKIGVDRCLQFCFPTKESKAPSSSKDFYLASQAELNGYLTYLR
jgi:hypothetical protein